MQKFILLFLVLFFCSCSFKEEKKINKTTNNIYKQSEMAALMLKMHAVNLENKELILKGEQPNNFPKEFLKIHSAKLTDSTDRDTSFKGFSNIYLNTFKEVYTSKDSLKLKHNNTINSCIACHQTTCLGPIPKIKKLFIK